MVVVKEGIKAVDHLLKVLNERREGYRKAAEDVNDAELVSLFSKYARQAQEFGNDLVKFSSFNTPEEAGTRAHGDAFRGWMDVKSVLTKGGPKAMLEACATGESAAISGYENTLEDEQVSGELHDILTSQLAEIRVAHAEIKEKSNNL